MKRFVIFTLLLVIALSAFAQGVIYGGLKYYVYPDTHEAVVIDENTWSGELVIPSEIKFKDEAYTVKTISGQAFFNCTELTKVTLPKSLEKITSQMYTWYGPWGWMPECFSNPFRGCTSLESIEVDEDNNNFCSVDGALFSKDMKSLFSYPAGKKQKSYFISENVRKVCGFSFSNSQYLTDIIMSDSVTFLDAGAFEACKNIQSVRLSENIDHIDYWTFESCESLLFLEIPEKVKDFWGEAFRWSGIKTFVIRGIFSEELRNDIFDAVSDSAVLYVQNSEISKFKKVFPGTVLPLESFTGINATKPSNNPSSNTIFDLQGRRILGTPSRGVYIKDGKKYVKK